MRPLPEWGLGNNRDRVKGYSDLIRDHFSQSVGGGLLRKEGEINIEDGKSVKRKDLIGK